MTRDNRNRCTASHPPRLDRRLSNDIRSRPDDYAISAWLSFSEAALYLGLSIIETREFLDAAKLPRLHIAREWLDDRLRVLRKTRRRLAAEIERVPIANREL